VRKIKLDPLAVELSTDGELGWCTADKDMPLTLGVLGVSRTGVVVSVKVAEVLQLLQAHAFVALNMRRVPNRDAVPPARLARSTRECCALGEAVKGSPQSDRSQADPQRNIKPESAWGAGHRDRDNLLDGSSNGWVLDEVAHHLDPPNYVERPSRIPIGHPLALF